MPRVKRTRRHKKRIYTTGETTEEEPTKPIPIPESEILVYERTQIIEKISLTCTDTLVHLLKEMPLERYFELDELIELVKLDTKNFLNSVKKNIPIQDAMRIALESAMKIEILKLRMLGEEEYLKI